MLSHYMPRWCIKIHGGAVQKLPTACIKMHEIVTLQLGQRANYLATHFWNLQVRSCNCAIAHLKIP